MQIKTKTALLLALAFSLLLSACTEKGIKEAPEQYLIYNMHEHIESYADFGKTLEAMEATGTEKILLVGSPEATLYTGKPAGFNNYEPNNKEVLKIKKAYPDRVLAFPTIDPKDTDKLEKLKAYMEQGADGLKLYSGHSMFYDLPLNDSGMYPVYAYLQENNIPLLFHINPGKEPLMEETEAVLRDFPRLKLICPHFCLSSINTTRLEYLMDTYPNLWTDVSFGFYAKDGFERISRDPEKYKALINKYQDRVLFGTDMVITSHPRKTAEWIANLTMCYRNILEKEHFTCNVGEEINIEINGMKIDPDTLHKIYVDNPKRILERV